MPIPGIAAIGTALAGAGAGSKLMGAANLAMGAGTLMGGAGSIFGGGEEEQVNIPQQTFDYTNYAMAMQRATRNKILNMIAEKKYEGFKGGANLSTVAQSAAMQATQQKPPDYFAQSKEFAQNMGDEGVTEVLAAYQGYAPQTEIYKSDEEKTEFDRIAEANGIVVTKYQDFQTAGELREALFEKAKAEVTVSDLDILIGEKIGGLVLDRLFPGANISKFCELGQCDDLYAGVIRGIKAMSRATRMMMGTSKPETKSPTEKT